MTKRKLVNKKARKEIDRYPLVEVRWADVVSDSAWQAVGDVHKAKLPECVTKGHLLSQSKGITRIFGDFSKGKEEGSVEELGNTTLIPNSIIISIKEIKLKKEVTMAKKKVKKKKIKKKKKTKKKRK
tara:strand:+ start:359 stop:739 length:381 start_codon:yes stop_codon:yes gene_type:complete